MLVVHCSRQDGELLTTYSVGELGTTLAFHSDTSIPLIFVWFSSVGVLFLYLTHLWHKEREKGGVEEVGIGIGVSFRALVRVVFPS